MDEKGRCPMTFGTFFIPLSDKYRARGQPKVSDMSKEDIGGSEKGSEAIEQEREEAADTDVESEDEAESETEDETEEESEQHESE